MDAMKDVNDWNRRGSGASGVLKNRRSLSLMAMMGSTPPRFRQFSSRLACPPAVSPDLYGYCERYNSFMSRPHQGQNFTCNPPSREVGRACGVCASKLQKAMKSSFMNGLWEFPYHQAMSRRSISCCEFRDRKSTRLNSSH